MKIKIERKPFWLWVLLFCYKRLKHTHPELPMGIPQMRDPENICPDYAPRKWRAGDHPAQCESDGHYLCKGCAFFNPSDENEIN